jgi:hypothetical protein
VALRVLLGEEGYARLEAALTQTNTLPGDIRGMLKAEDVASSTTPDLTSVLIAGLMLERPNLRYDVSAMDLALASIVDALDALDRLSAGNVTHHHYAI